MQGFVSRFVAVLLCVVGLHGVGSAAETTPQAVVVPAYDTPLGIGLEGWPYPAPVHFFDVKGSSGSLRMAYMDVPPTGTPNNRVVVLLHGKNFDSSYWSGPIRFLSAAGFRVVVPDQIGFNKSAKPDLTYTFASLAANTADLLDSLGIDKVDVVGHSTGGMLAVRFARRYPGRVAHLVLEDPLGLEDYSRLASPPDLTALTKAELDQTPVQYRAFLARYFPMLPPAEYEPFVEWRARVALSGEFDRFARASADLYMMIYSQPVIAEFRKLGMPVLLLAGERDRTAPFKALAMPEVAATMGDIPVLAGKACAQVQQCTLHIVPGVGHVPHLEAPRLFQAALLDFLR